MQFLDKRRHIPRYLYALTLSLALCQYNWAIPPSEAPPCGASSDAAYGLLFSPICLYAQYDAPSSPGEVWDHPSNWPTSECTSASELTIRRSSVSCSGHVAMGSAEVVRAASTGNGADADGKGGGSENDLGENSSLKLFVAKTEQPEQKVQWKTLMANSSLYLGVMHSFRVVMEPSTRAALHNSVFGGYIKALGAMHGWSDGDGYYENYLGHPIQGAVSAYVWIHNDTRYRTVEFGRNRDYWMSRLRAIGYAWAFSEQFEIGLTSEATIGQIQRYCCAYGFVDHVITPAGGGVWLIGGDILDRYVVRPIEGRTQNTAVRALVRTTLNFPLGFANLMALRYPWHRENRPGVREYTGELYFREPTQAELNPSALPMVPRVELIGSLPSITRYGNHSCTGGTGIVGFRLSNTWQWTAEVGGCELRGLHKGWSGDALTFVTGPQWVLHNESRWSPHAHVRFGGQKITEDYCLKYGDVGHMLQPARPCLTDPTGYLKHYEATGPSVSIGTGVDYQLNRAFELRVAHIDYVHSWLGPVAGTDFSQGTRFTFGIGLKVGTW